LAIKLPRTTPACPCGRHLPAFEKIIGRDTDIIRSKNGYITVQVLVYILKHLDGISQYKFIQYDLDGITMEYIPTELFQKDQLDIVQEKINQELSCHFPITFKKVDFIPPTPSGKPQIIQSKLLQANQQATSI
jgi:phenylacetate-CoA ligase